jgi:hypothetical protein
MCIKKKIVFNLYIYLLIVYYILSLHIEVNIYLTYKYAGLSMIIYNIVCNYQRDHQRLTVISGIS